MRLFTYRAVTFALGLTWLFLGAGSMSDWDFCVSVLMAGASAAVMPAFDRALWERHEYGLAFVIGCFPVSSVYALYWTNIAGTPEVMVPENFGASWRLKGHAANDFWEWVATWAVCIRKPSDLGYNDDGYELPELNIKFMVS